jgi:hypothetical protein
MAVLSATQTSSIGESGPGWDRHMHGYSRLLDLEPLA